MPAACVPVRHHAAQLARQDQWLHHRTKKLMGFALENGQVPKFHLTTPHKAVPRRVGAAQPLHGLVHDVKGEVDGAPR